MFKKIILLIGIICFSFVLSQTNKNYIVIGYSSICCGTPSNKQVFDYLLDFQKQNQLEKFEVWVESGLGDEGEYDIYIGIDQLDAAKQDLFWNQLKQIAKEHNDNRKVNHDGYVNIGNELISNKLLKYKIKNPSTKISTLSVYNY